MYQAMILLKGIGEIIITLFSPINVVDTVTLIRVGDMFECRWQNMTKSVVINSESLSSPIFTTKSQMSTMHKQNEKLKNTVAEMKEQYQKHLGQIQAEVKTTINSLNERNQARIRHEVALAQKRLSSKLHSHYKTLLGSVLDNNEPAIIGEVK